VWGAVYAAADCDSQSLVLDTTVPYGDCIGGVLPDGTAVSDFDGSESCDVGHHSFICTDIVSCLTIIKYCFYYYRLVRNLSVMVIPQTHPGRLVST